MCERARAPGRVYNAIAVLPLRDVCITLYYSTAARGVGTMLQTRCSLTRRVHHTAAVLLWCRYDAVAALLVVSARCGSVALLCEARVTL